MPAAPDAKRSSPVHSAPPSPSGLRALRLPGETGKHRASAMSPEVQSEGVQSQSWGAGGGDVPEGAPPRRQSAPRPRRLVKDTHGQDLPFQRLRADLPARALQQLPEALDSHEARTSRGAARRRGRGRPFILSLYRPRPLRPARRKSGPAATQRRWESSAVRSDGLRRPEEKGPEDGRRRVPSLLSPMFAFSTHDPGRGLRRRDNQPEGAPPTPPISPSWCGNPCEVGLLGCHRMRCARRTGSCAPPGLRYIDAPRAPEVRARWAPDWSSQRVLLSRWRPVAVKP